MGMTANVVMPLIEVLYPNRVRLDGQCVVWTGECRRGYGRLQRDGVRWSAHRLAYILAHGPIPDGLLVCHTCDNPSCVRLEHLFLGTDADNFQDMHAKGRYVGRLKLTTSQVEEIRRRYSAGERQVDLARQFGVTQPAISIIVNQKVWKGVARNYTENNGCDGPPRLANVSGKTGISDAVRISERS